MVLRTSLLAGEAIEFPKYNVMSVVMEGNYCIGFHGHIQTHIYIHIHMYIIYSMHILYIMPVSYMCAYILLNIYVNTCEYMLYLFTDLNIDLYL